MTPNPARLAAIHAACFSNPRPWSAQEIASLLSDPTTVLIEVVAGFALGRIIADEAELLTLAVAPDRRRRGVGADILAGFLMAARERGASRVFLEVAADNEAALALYRRHGFCESGRRRGYYRDSLAAAVDAIVMRRDSAPGPDEN